MLRPVAATPAALLAALLAVSALPARADVLSQGYELVVLGEPAAPAGDPPPGPVDVTLTWRVREIFKGEPDGMSIAVRHLRLEPSQVAALASGERWIVVANPDAERPGRWLAPMPLKATPEAVDAFRRWSAPPDVRPPRDVAEVMEELRGQELAGPRPAAAPSEADAAEEGPILVEIEEPEAEPAATTAPAAAGDRVLIASSSEPTPAPPEARSVATPPSPAEPEPELVEPAELPCAAAGPELLAERSRPARAIPAGTSGPLARDLEQPEPAVVRSSRAEEPTAVVRSRRAAEPTVVAAGWSEGEPPLSWVPALVPTVGPGLPPSPPVRPIGPPPAEREDLKKPKARSGGDA